MLSYLLNYYIRNVYYHEIRCMIQKHVKRNMVRLDFKARMRFLWFKDGFMMVLMVQNKTSTQSK